MKQEEKLRRFDDVYKLSLTLIAIMLTFGSKFYEELGIEFFVMMPILYISALFFWGFGHLSQNVHSEVFVKLLGWWALMTALCTTILNYLVARAPGEIYPPYLACPTMFLGFILYLSCYIYLKEMLQTPKILFLIPLLATVSFSLWNLISWVN
jgi:hypothetical protein